MELAIASNGLTLDLPVVLGTGATVLLLALVERLRRTFATREELNGVGDRVNALQTLYLQVREAADDARQRIAAAEAEQRHQWERIAEQVIRPLERITDKLEGVAEAQAAQAAIMEQIGRRLDRADATPRPGGHA
jgi:biopolymer transport protein ExbB/TolQ